MENSHLIKAILVSLIFGGLGMILLNFLNKIKSQIDYEEEFVKEHKDWIKLHPQVGRPMLENIMPLTFVHQKVEHLKSLCEQSRSKWTPKYYLNVQNSIMNEPVIEIQRLGFRRLIKVQIQPILVEIIRCNKKYALLEAGDGLSSYVLEKHEYNSPNRNKDEETLFYILAKFHYRQEIEVSKNDKSNFSGSGQSFQERQSHGQNPTVVPPRRVRKNRRAD